VSDVLDEFQDQLGDVKPNPVVFGNAWKDDFEQAVSIAIE